MKVTIFIYSLQLIQSRGNKQGNAYHHNKVKQNLHIEKFLTIRPFVSRHLKKIKTIICDFVVISNIELNSDSLSTVTEVLQKLREFYILYVYDYTLLH